MAPVINIVLLESRPEVPKFRLQSTTGPWPIWKRTVQVVGHHTCMQKQLDLHEWCAGMHSYACIAQLAQLKLRLHVYCPILVQSQAAHVCMHADLPLMWPVPFSPARLPRRKGWGLLIQVFKFTPNIYSFLLYQSIQQ